MDLELTDEEKRLLAADDRATGRTGLWIAAILGLVGVAVLIPICQSVMWLKTGVWTPFSIASALSSAGITLPAVTWVGLQRVIDWVLALPVALAFCFAFVLAVHLFTRNDRKPEAEALRVARMKRARRARLTR